MPYARKLELAKSASLGIEAMKAETPPGCCICCGAALPPRITRPRIKCHDPECERLYVQVYSMDREATRRQSSAEATP